MCMYISVCGSVHLRAVDLGSQQSVYIELEASVSLPTRILQTELKSSARAACALAPGSLFSPRSEASLVVFSLDKLPVLRVLKASLLE